VYINHQIGPPLRPEEEENRKDKEMLQWPHNPRLQTEIKFLLGYLFSPLCKLAGGLYILLALISSFFLYFFTMGKVISVSTVTDFYDLCTKWKVFV